jgi:hypothetical protein
MKYAIGLYRSMIDENLLGKVFATPSMWTWRTVGKLVDGLPLTEPRELELYRQCTGRTKLPTGPVRPSFGGLIMSPPGTGGRLRSLPIRFMSLRGNIDCIAWAGRVTQARRKVT